ncbi:MAG: hypothetical protein U5M23_12995 [Marinagarivorans sp.]|nr:hypothetical protein [Marinagarivorans sp.]
MNKFLVVLGSGSAALHSQEMAAERNGAAANVKTAPIFKNPTIFNITVDPVRSVLSAKPMHELGDLKKQFRHFITLHTEQASGQLWAGRKGDFRCKRFIRYGVLVQFARMKFVRYGGRRHWN